MISVTFHRAVAMEVCCYSIQQAILDGIIKLGAEKFYVATRGDGRLFLGYCPFCGENIDVNFNSVDDLPLTEESVTIGGT